MAEFLPRMPTKEEIKEKAIEIFQEEYLRTHPEARVAPTPEEKELKEGSYWERARSELMSGVRSDLEKYLHYLEEEAEKVREALGIKPPPELPELMKRLEDLEAKYRRAREQLREARKQLEEARKKIEELKKPPPPPPPPPEIPKPPVGALTEFPEQIEKLRKDLMAEAETQFIRAGLTREDFLAHRADVAAIFRTALLMHGEKPKKEAEEEIIKYFNREVERLIRRVKRPPVVRPPVVRPTGIPRPPPGVPYGVIIKTPEMLKAEIMKRMKPNMTPEEVIKAIREVYGWQYTEEGAASYYRNICLEMGWPIPDWVKEKLGIKE